MSDYLRIESVSLVCDSLSNNIKQKAEKNIDRADKLSCREQSNIKKQKHGG